MSQPILALCVLALLRAGNAPAQTDWQPHSANPVLPPGGTIWDAAAVGQPSCLVEEGVFRMWYTGAGADLRGRILHAHSSDGAAWTRHPNPVLHPGEDGAWDGFTIDTPAVVRVADTYFLYYFGQRASGSVDGSSIGLATSSDGLEYRRAGKGPVLEPGPPGSWDSRWVESPTVIHNAGNGRWLMWYSGMSPEWKASVGLATSTDGVHWQKHPANPILTPGPEDSWDDYWAAVPTVVRFRSGLWLFYSGVNAADLADQRADFPAIGFAWSGDGVTWLGDRSEPVFGPDSAGLAGPWAPTVVLDEASETLLIWYDTHAGINHATAPVPDRTRSGSLRRVNPN